MSPPPERGSVIRYAYLWADESVEGREEGRKDRPALVLALSVKEEDGSTQLLVLAITHTARADPETAVAIPHEVKRRIGLDDVPAGIVTTEANLSSGQARISARSPGAALGRSSTGAFRTVYSER